MKTFKHCILPLLCMYSFIGCTSDEVAQFVADHDVTFVGQVYDGSTGKVLTEFSIDLIAGTRSLDGNVDSENGRFTIRGSSALDDYIISVNAEGYRAFESRNGMIGVPASLAGARDVATTQTNQTRYFDVYLFPNEIEAPEFTLSVQATDDPGKELDGKVRLRPSGGSSLEISSASVGSQVWGNDLDLQAGVKTGKLEKGEAIFEAGSLIYGVTYAIDVHSVSGYKQNAIDEFTPETSTFVAGRDLVKTIAIEPQNDGPVKLVSNNATDCVPPDISASLSTTKQANITLTFASDIDLASAAIAQAQTEVGFRMVSPNTDADTVRNELNSSDNGAAIAVSGNTLVFSWVPSVGLGGLGTYDAGDIISQIEYGDDGAIAPSQGIEFIEVQRLGSPESVQTLGQLGVTSLLCEVAAP